MNAWATTPRLFSISGRHGIIIKGSRSTMIPWDEWVFAKAYTHSGMLVDLGTFYNNSCCRIWKKAGGSCHAFIDIPDIAMTDINIG